MPARAASASSAERQIARVAPPGRYAKVLKILVGPKAMTRGAFAAIVSRIGAADLSIASS